MGSLAPIFVYLAGFSRKSTTSCRDSFASSCPATSAKVTPVSFCTYTLALLLPTPITPPPEDILRITTPSRIQIRIRGAKDSTTFRIRFVVVSGISW